MKDSRNRPAVLSNPNRELLFISINYVGDIAKHSGILTHGGQTGYDAGYAAGGEIVYAGTMQGICVNKEVGNLRIDLRCQGIAVAVIRSVAVKLRL